MLQARTSVALLEDPSLCWTSNFVCACVKINFFSFHVYELFEVHLYLKLVFDREDPSISEVKMDLKIILGDLEREEK